MPCDRTSRMFGSRLTTLFRERTRNTSDVAKVSQEPSAKKTIPSRLTVGSSLQDDAPFERTLEPNSLETDYYTSIQEPNWELPGVYIRHVGCYLVLQAYRREYRQAASTALQSLQNEGIKEVPLDDLRKVWLQTPLVKEGLEKHQVCSDCSSCWLKREIARPRKESSDEHGDNTDTNRVTASNVL
jgi:hypothetical protein